MTNIKTHNKLSGVLLVVSIFTILKKYISTEDMNRIELLEAAQKFTDIFPQGIPKNNNVKESLQTSRKFLVLLRQRISNGEINYKELMVVSQKFIQLSKKQYNFNQSTDK